MIEILHRDSLFDLRNHPISARFGFPLGGLCPAGGGGVSGGGSQGALSGREKRWLGNHSSFSHAYFGDMCIIFVYNIYIYIYI